MRRRRKRKPLTDEQRAELRRQNKNARQRSGYAKSQKRKFFIEYSELCKQYGCIITGNIKHLTKVKRGETITTVKGHLEEFLDDLNDNY